MKITITGLNGYIGNELTRYLEKKIKNVSIKRLNLKGIDLSNLHLDTDIVIHTAALVHKKDSSLTKEDYYEVNTNLTYKLGEISKKQGVGHFIFFSTMAVYGNYKDLTEINSNTKLKPNTHYGKSKLFAEQQLATLEDENFVLSCIRPPMVYGPGCPGNYSRLKKIALTTPVFPQVINKRSMIFIYNLTELILQIIQNKDSGIFHAQDTNYVTTTRMVEEIAKVNNKKIIVSNFIGMFIILFKKNRFISKVFGDLTYSKELTNYRDNDYQRFEFEESIRISEIDKLKV